MPTTRKPPSQDRAPHKPQKLSTPSCRPMNVHVAQGLPRGEMLRKPENVI